MNSEPPLTNLIKCCSCSDSSNDGSVQWHRSVKRRFDQVEAVWTNRKDSSNDSDYSSVARVEIENEITALRETVSSQQQTIQELYTELEEERNASSSAANEAMSMILRLQREKAEAQMEARQYKRYAEEKMAHDQQELLAFEDLLYKREQIIQSLTCEVQAHKHRLMSYGFDQCEADDMKLNSDSFTGQWERVPSFASSHGRNRSMVERCESLHLYTTGEPGQLMRAEETPTSGIQKPSPYDYPPLRCNLNEAPAQEFEFNDFPWDFEKYTETPRTREEQLQNLEYRIYQLERNPGYNHRDGELGGTRNILEKEVVGFSPRRPKHARRFSADSSCSSFGLVKEPGHEFAPKNPSKLRPNGSLKRMVEFSNSEDYSCYRKVDSMSDTSDRIYTIDSIQGVQTGNMNLRKAVGDENGVCLGDPDIRQRNNVENALGSPYKVDKNTRVLRAPDTDQVPESKVACVLTEDFMSTPRSVNTIDTGETEVKKLYMRLQALEADRESMKQAIVSMRTDKAQLILLREIAQQLCKDLQPEKRIIAKKPSLIGSISFMSVLKWIVSFVFWRKKAHRSKYMFGLSSNNMGLLLLLEKSPPMKQLRCLTRAQL